MSHPPDYPGRQRLKRAATRAGSDAYQGAFEAVGAVLVACGIGFWIDGRWDTSPWGVVIGAVIGFAAMVLRLIRLGKELHPEATGTDGKETTGAPRGAPVARKESDDPLGVGLTPGMSDALRSDSDEAASEMAPETTPGKNDRE